VLGNTVVRDIFLLISDNLDVSMTVSNNLLIELVINQHGRIVFTVVW
jgi:hypothetical protein